MSIYDDYSNPYDYSAAPAAGYQTPQIIGASTTPSQGAPASPPSTYYQGPPASAPPGGGFGGIAKRGESAYGEILQANL
jgi:hypothetical protein